jgi:hypothetical protein
MSNDLFRLDIELLLCRYGRQRVLSGLAETESCSVGELTKRLENIRKNKDARKQKAKPKRSLLEEAATLVGDDPQRLEAVRPLVVAFENRILFPSLKSTHRFLESHGQPTSGIKSRKAAGLPIVKLLAHMSPQELDELRHSASRDGQSDFSLLSQAILRGG